MYISERWQPSHGATSHFHFLLVWLNRNWAFFNLHWVQFLSVIPICRFKGLVRPSRSPKLIFCSSLEISLTSSVRSKSEREFFCIQKAVTILNRLRSVWYILQNGKMFIRRFSEDCRLISSERTVDCAGNLKITYTLVNVWQWSSLHVMLMHWMPCSN